MSEDKIQTRRKLETEHSRAQDGRCAHPVSNAPYGIETHMNEEQAKRQAIDEKMAKRS